MALTGNILSVPFLIGLSFMDRSQASYAVILVVLFWFIQALNTCSLRVNQIDIAPRYKEKYFSFLHQYVRIDNHVVLKYTKLRATLYHFSSLQCLSEPYMYYTANACLNPSYMIIVNLI